SKRVRDKDKEEDEDEDDVDRSQPTRPAWHGTLLPQGDADAWLAAAFAEYERLVAQEKAHEDPDHADGAEAEARHGPALDLYQFRTSYLAAARALEDVPLARTRAALTQDHWYRIAAGKGVCLLHTLRQVMGAAVFDEFMDAFGRE